MKIETIIFKPPDRAHVVMSDGSYLGNVRSVWVSGEMGKPTVARVEVVLQEEKLTTGSLNTAGKGVPPKK